MSFRWVGIVFVLALLGAIVISYAWRRWSTALLGWVLFLASLLAPIEQARISTSVSLFKHVDYGAWFAAAAVGYLFAALPNAIERIRGPLLAGGLAILVMASALGASIVSRQYAGWPVSSQLTSMLMSQHRHGAVYLVEDSNVESYYLRASVTPNQMYNTFYFGYTDPKSGQYLANGPAYASAIKERRFTFIVLDFGDTAGTDKEIVADIGKYGGYRLVATIPFQTAAGAGQYEVWENLRVPLPAGDLGRVLAALARVAAGFLGDLVAGGANDLAAGLVGCQLRPRCPWGLVHRFLGAHFSMR
jgi:hypothetical protein